MPYYTGDYYRGDYYQGDVFGFLRKAVGTVAGVAGKILPGPLGSVAKVISQVATPGRPVPAISTNLPMIAGPTPPLALMGAGGGVSGLPDVPKTTPGAVPQPGFRGAVERFLPGGQTGYVSGAAVGQAAPGGWHWNKSFSYAKGLPAGSFLVRNRSMNPLNPRALRRTVRRQRGAVGLMRAVLAGSGYTIKRSGLPGKGRKRRRS